MKKDVVYTMRMTSRVREALKRAANKERRTLASLLDKIITDYLQEEGFLPGSELGEDRRRSPRQKTPLPAKAFFTAGDEVESYPSVIHDLSMGGVMVVFPKGSEVRFTSTGKLPQFEVSFELPRAGEQLRFGCDARHMRDTSSEIQVGASFRNVNEHDLQTLKNYIM